MFSRTAEKNRLAYAWQKLYDLLFIALFFALVWFVTTSLPRVDVLVRSLSVLDIAVLVFAVMRLVQLVAHDNVMQWFRDAFLNIRIKRLGAQADIDRKMPAAGLRREAAVLVSCPWCLSMWLSLGTFYAWFAWPQTHVLIYILALSGVGTLVYLGLKRIEHSSSQK